jgi:hypothetical protein
VLSGEDQKGVLEPGPIERIERRLIDLGQLEAGNDGAEGGGEWSDIEWIGHGLALFVAAASRKA